MGMPLPPRPPSTTTHQTDFKPRNKIMKQEEKKPQSAGEAIFTLISLGIVGYVIYLLWNLYL